jgi:rod shape-determining protein MreC
VYDKQVVRRRRAVLGALVLLSIVLLTGYFGEGNGGFFHGLQSTGQAVLSPIEAGASRAFQPVRDLVGGTGDIFSAKSDNKKLKHELASTRTQLAQAQTAIHDNAQLRALLNLPKTPGFPQTKRVTARVLSKAPTAWYSTIAIDVGRSDGVKVDQPVITGDGLIGHVSSVNGGTAVVTLITDASSCVSAEVEPDGASAIVKPNVGDPNDMQLQFIQKGKNVTKGQQVVTSGFASGGLESIYPRGIPIGQVTTVSTDELELYRTVHIQPYADFQKVDYVQVLTSRPRVVQPLPGIAGSGP